ncbi:MAG: hypothetical protein AAFW00_19740 [Bacteroidota bacterium]
MNTYANDLPYWKTGKSSAESWMNKTEKLITEAGGEVDTRISGKPNGKEAILFIFMLEGARYKILWPVLPTKKIDEQPAALRQCATMIYHDTKARVLRLKIFPPKVVFSDYLIGPNGQTLAEIGQADIPKALIQISKSIQ